MKQLIRDLLARRNLEIINSATAVKFLESRDVDLLLDVGANRGQFAYMMRRSGYRGHIYSFEPIRAVFDDLSSATAGDPGWQVFNVGVGKVPGKATISVARNSVFSSLKPTTDSAGAFDPASATAYEEEIEIVTLDERLRDDPARHVFLKIDTQGFEEEVLAGAAATLGRCVGLQLELPIDHFYEGVWSFEEALSFLRQQGFTPAQIRPVNFSTQDPASAVEFDCIFRRI
jgi:FkbM family methyltransferase